MLGLMDEAALRNTIPRQPNVCFLFCLLCTVFSFSCFFSLGWQTKVVVTDRNLAFSLF